MGSPRTHSLFLRLAVLFLGAGVLPAVGLGLWSAHTLGSRERARATAELEARAALAASLVRDFVARGRDKLRTMARLLAREGASGQRPDAVAAQLVRLIEPRDLFLDVQAYGAGTMGEVVGGRFLANAAIPEVEKRQSIASQQRQINANLRSELVQRPLQSNRAYVAQQQQAVASGFEGLPLAVPVVPPGAEGAAAIGVVVGYLDLRTVPDLLRPLGDADAGIALAVSDGSGAEVAAVGAGWTAPAGTGGWLRVERPCPIASASELGAGGDQGPWRIVVQQDDAVVYASAARVRSRTAWSTALAAALALGLGLAAAGWIARPLRRLGDAADRLAAGDRGVRVGLERKDEIGQLALRFDGMAAALEQLDEAKDDFVRTVSHELRTPLTSMRMSVANVLDGLVGPLGDGPRAALERVRTDLDRLGRTVDDLLRLTRLEVGLDAAPVAATGRAGAHGGGGEAVCDLSAAVDHCVSMLRPLAEAGGRAIERHGGPGGQVRAPSDLVQRVLTNLLDNAVRYAAADRRDPVRVVLGEATVAVGNPGGGLEGRHAGAFVRGGAAGARADGLGLGLTIVRRLLEHCGGTLEIGPESAAESGDGLRSGDADAPWSWVRVRFVSAAAVAEATDRAPASGRGRGGPGA